MSGTPTNLYGSTWLYSFCSSACRTAASTGCGATTAGTVTAAGPAKGKRIGAATPDLASWANRCRGHYLAPGRCGAWAQLMQRVCQQRLKGKSYSFTAPRARPRAICFCNKKTTTITGKSWTTAPALREPHNTL